MKTKFAAAICSAAAMFLFSYIPCASADESEEGFSFGGILRGVGKHFEIRDSQYLNITADSTEEIDVRLESLPEMVTLEIYARDGGSLTDLKLSGFPANSTFHKYEDSYDNYAPVAVDADGFFSFPVDISRDRTIMIQPRKSTKIIRDDLSGGDCMMIGSWNSASKTCTLDRDVNETVQISNDNITLDGNGHKVTGTGTGYGIALSGRNNSVKNISISNFLRGIYARKKFKVSLSQIDNNYYGIYVDGGNASDFSSAISESKITNSQIYGLYLYRTRNNSISGNDISQGNVVGIFQSSSSNSVYEDNNVFGNVTGAVIYGDYTSLQRNSFYLNSKMNFYLKSFDMMTNDIDRSNTVGGKPIYYEKNIVGATYENLKDVGSFYCSNCQGITLKNLTLPEKDPQLVFWHTNNSKIEGLNSQDERIAIELYGSSNNEVIKNAFRYIKLYDFSNQNRIFGNNIMDTDTMVGVYSSSGNLFYDLSSLSGNYWKAHELNCQDTDNNNICNNPFFFNGGWDPYPLAQKIDISPEPSCCSSVLFLPGHQATRLYLKDQEDNEDQLWEPTNHNEDVRQLYLNESGESAEFGIYTGEIIDEVYGLADNVYKGFISSMNQFAISGAINEWKQIPYDWRLPLEKIVDDGVKLKNGENLDIVGEIKRMASASKTGKVTLIGHSNGGLLAKSLIDKLKETGDEKLIDRLIMVATPQLGTPKAVAALLHGDETSLLHGFILDKKTGRGFAENMTSAYNLLPSRKYFDIVQSPVVKFDEDVKNIYDFRLLYGENIDNWDKFRKFLLGDNGARIDPEFDDTDSPNILRESLLLKTERTHGKLDEWQAPEKMEVIQIAGWGLDTISGIEYDDCDIPFCPDKLSNLDRSLLMTMDGDETVVIPSAVEMGSNTERYYLNLNRYNRLVNLKVDREHADMLEIESLQEFIKNIIKGDKTLTEYLSKEKPEVKDEDKRLRFRLHSPVVMDLYDEEGKHTGLVDNNNFDLRLSEEQIPNSYYLEFGETKYAGAGDAPVNIVLTGEDLGTFTFEIDQLAGENVEKNTVFGNIPVMKNTRATLSVSEDVSAIKIDVDNDGRLDIIFPPGEEIGKDKLLEILEKIIYALDVDRTVSNRLANKIDNAKKQIEKGHNIPANAMLENVKQQIENFNDEKTPEKLRLSKDEADKLIEIINRLQLME